MKENKKKLNDIFHLAKKMSENNVVANWTSHFLGLETLFQAWGMTSQYFQNFTLFLSLSQPLQDNAKHVAPQERHLCYLDFSEYLKLLKKQIHLLGHQSIVLTKFYTAKQQNAETIDNWYERLTNYYK